MLSTIACGDDGNGGDSDAGAEFDGATTAPFALGGWWEVEVETFSHWETLTLRFPLEVEQVGALVTICGSSSLGQFEAGTVQVPIATNGQTTLLDMSVVDDDQLVGTLMDGEELQTITWRRMSEGPQGEINALGSVLGRSLSIQNKNAYGLFFDGGEEVYVDLRTPFCAGLAAPDTYDGEGVFGLVMEAALSGPVSLDVPYSLGAELLNLSISDQSDALRVESPGGPFSNRDIVDGSFTFSEIAGTAGGRVAGSFVLTLRQPGDSITGDFSFEQDIRWVPSFIAPEVDQDNLSFIFGTNNTFLPNNSGTQLAQVFTAQGASDIVQIELNLAQSEPGGALRIGLRPAPLGIPDLSDSSELAFATISDGTLLRAIDGIKVDLAERIPLVDGESYAITVEAMGGEYLLTTTLGDFYADGDLFWRSDAAEAWMADTIDTDISFRTRVFY